MEGVFRQEIVEKSPLFTMRWAIRHHTFAAQKTNIAINALAKKTKVMKVEIDSFKLACIVRRIIWALIIGAIILTVFVAMGYDIH